MTTSTITVTTTAPADIVSHTPTATTHYAGFAASDVLEKVPRAAVGWIDLKSDHTFWICCHEEPFVTTTSGRYVCSNPNKIVRSFFFSRKDPAPKRAITFEMAPTDGADPQMNELPSQIMMTHNDGHALHSSDELARNRFIKRYETISLKRLTLESEQMEQEYDPHAGNWTTSLEFYPKRTYTGTVAYIQLAATIHNSLQTSLGSEPSTAASSNAQQVVSASPATGYACTVM